MSDAVFSLHGDGAVSDEHLKLLKEQCLRWKQRAAAFYGIREKMQRARFCIWGNAGKPRDDGRQWDEDCTEKDYGLFDGCSDLKFRWGDRITMDKQALLIGALGMANVSISGSGPAAQRMAGNMLTLLNWMRRRLGARWLGNWMALTNWYVGDSPAVAMMAVRWRKDSNLDTRTLTREELGQAWLARELARADDDEYERLAADERVRGMLAALGNADAVSEEQAAALIMGLMPVTDEREARRAAKEIAAKGESEILVESAGEEGVEIEAKRFLDDFIVMDNCRDFETEGMWFVPQWIGLEALEASGWDKDFIEEIKAQGPVPVMSNGNDDDPTPAGNSGYSARERRRQVIWAYVTGIDAKGRKGKYQCVFGSGEGTAFGWRLLTGRNGRWPAAFFQREKLDQYTLNSRGVAELAEPAQGMAKALWDGAANNALLGNTPPILAKGFNVRNQTVSPLRVIGMNVNEEFSYMGAPAYPAAGMRVADRIDQENKDYFGMAHKESDPGTVAVRQRLEVNWFLSQACDVYAMMLGLAQVNMTDEQLETVTDDAGMPAMLKRTDIAGTFGITVELNADDLDTDKVIEKAKAMGSFLLAMDRNQVIDTTPIVSSTLVKMYPDVGPRALRSAEAAAANEEEEEAKNLAMIRAGVMPRMNTDGLWNYRARLGMYQTMQQQNPQAFADMAPDKAQMLQQWLAALSQQATQFGENRAIGKTGVQGVGAGG